MIPQESRIFGDLIQLEKINDVLWKVLTVNLK